jgi:hypothetical protein
MNNAAYLDCLEESLLAAGGESAALTTLIPRRFRIEYLQPAAVGSTLTARTWPLGPPANGAMSSARAWLLEAEQGGELARGIVTPDGAADDA